MLKVPGNIEEVFAHLEKVAERSLFDYPIGYHCFDGVGVWAYTAFSTTREMLEHIAYFEAAVLGYDDEYFRIRDGILEAAKKSNWELNDSLVSVINGLLRGEQAVLWAGNFQDELNKENGGYFEEYLEQLSEEVDVPLKRLLSRPFTADEKDILTDLLNQC